MESDHFSPSNLSGCPGGQFSPAPAFAFWSYFEPCGCGPTGNKYLRMFLNSPVYVEYSLYYCAVLLAIALSAVCALVVMLVCLPFTAPLHLLFAYKPNWFPCRCGGMSQDMLMFYPGIAVTLLITCTFLLVMQCLWLPFALCGSLLWPICLSRGGGELSWDVVTRYYGRPVVIFSEHVHRLFEDDD